MPVTARQGVATHAVTLPERWERALARLLMPIAQERNHNRPPIFVLTAARSGSTLLRFILDSHPELACPPEIELASACTELTRTWGVLENAIASRSGSAADPLAPTAEVLASVREAADAVLSRYLQSTGKRQLCEKSMQTIFHADLMTQVYPEAKFICLYRHCMDVIASVLDGMGPEKAERVVSASPTRPSLWFLMDCIARNPRNTVAAVAEYWLECSQRSMTFEENNPGRCYRMRYEDLVAEPEETMAALFSFLDIAQEPGITRACFQDSHDSGPGDPKILLTSKIQSGSVGAGHRVPAIRLAGSARSSINDTLAALNYRTVDEQWGALGSQSDPRTRASVGGPLLADGAQSAGSIGQPDPAAVLQSISDQIATRTPAQLRRIADFCPLAARIELTIVAQDGHGGQACLRWSFASVSARVGGAGHDEREEQPGGSGGFPVTVIASAQTWQSLLDGSANVPREAKEGRIRTQPPDIPEIGMRELRAIAAIVGLGPIP